MTTGRKNSREVSRIRVNGSTNAYGCLSLKFVMGDDAGGVRGGATRLPPGFEKSRAPFVIVHLAPSF